MALRPYGQYCGLSRALEILGERWGLLIVRDLLSGPHRFGELESSLAGIPTSVLATRLKELEGACVVERVVMTGQRRGTAYQLTDDGRALEPTLVAMGRWGGVRMGEPRSGEVVTAESLAMALRTAFRPDAAADTHRSIELRMGDIVLAVRIDGPTLDVATGQAPDGATVLTVTPEIRQLIDGDLTARDALASGVVTVDGDRAALDDFAEVFRLAD